MDLGRVTRRYQDQIQTLGRSGLNALFPYDFEVYMVALELTNSSGQTIDYLSFPILPESISKTEPKRTNIRNTSSGVTVLSSSTFMPEEIKLKGNFGRNFKILLSDNEPSIEGVAYSTSSGVYDLTQLGTNGNNLSFKSPFFNVGIKTGYGATRVLKSIISKSNGVDGDGKPFRLYFYNLALGESYLVAVAPSGITVNQSKEKNMIWEYNLVLKTIAPLNSLKSNVGQSSLISITSKNAIQTGVNVLGSEITSVLNGNIF
ncbi:MAG: hypothetical protein ACOC2U_04850 [bacterium]